jgi:hypothetical protein
MGGPPAWLAGTVRLVPAARALVAQRTRASDYGSEGWGFESLRARQMSRSEACGLLGRAPRRTVPIRHRTAGQRRLERTQNLTEDGCCPLLAGRVPGRDRGVAAPQSRAQPGLVSMVSAEDHRHAQRACDLAGQSQ